ncbi:hypothetical protein UlMin_039469 [Ulmus minor]
MMGCQSSKSKGVDASEAQAQAPPTPAPLPTFGINKDSQYASDLSSYEAACRVDPSLQSFDAVLHQRTTRVIGSLATGVEGGRTLSFNSLKEVTGCLLDMNQDVVNVFLENKTDIWNSQEMTSLVEQYFKTSLQTMAFCTELEGCLKRVGTNQIIIRAAVREFEEELAKGVDESMFSKTLQVLAKFEDAGDPFTAEFVKLFQSVYKEQITLFEKLQRRKTKLDKRLKSLKTWRKVSNVIFVTAFVSVLILSVVAAAIAAPPLVIALLGALAVPVGSVGKWCNMLWNRYSKEVRGQREIITAMQVRTKITWEDLESIGLLVNKLKIEIESLMHAAKFALAEEDSVKIVMDEIKKKLEGFDETIETLSQHNEKCIQFIRKSRSVILDKIMKRTNS